MVSPLAMRDWGMRIREIRVVLEYGRCAERAIPVPRRFFFCCHNPADEAACLPRLLALVITMTHTCTGFKIGSYQEVLTLLLGVLGLLL